MTCGILVLRHRMCSGCCARAASGHAARDAEQCDEIAPFGSSASQPDLQVARLAAAIAKEAGCRALGQKSLQPLVLQVGASSIQMLFLTWINALPTTQ